MGQRRDGTGGCPCVDEPTRRRLPSRRFSIDVAYGCAGTPRVERFAGGDDDPLLFEQRLRELRGRLDPPADIALRMSGSM